MKKKWRLGILAVAALAIVAVYLICTAPEIGDKSTYNIVNDSPNASLRVVEVSQKEKNITVEYAYTGETELVYGAYHRFEIWKEDGWYTIMPKQKNLVHLDIAYIINSGKTKQETYGWAGLGRLPKGRYRFVQEVSETVEDTRSESHVLAVEFELK